MRTFAFGTGQVVLDEDGSVTTVVHPVRGRSVLLDDDPKTLDGTFHQPERRWGKGFVITSAGSWRWDFPGAVHWRADGVDTTHSLGPLRLEIGRSVGEEWQESYTLTNVGDADMDLGSVAVSTPWRDVYHSSADSLAGAVHAHVWTGGSDAWVWAAPMDGSGPGLGLDLTDGHLWAYSVESRDQFTSSNIRGHLYLHVTDAARAPLAMGGQPTIALGPGESYAWSWTLRWCPDLPAFHATRAPLVRAEVTSAAVGDALTLLVDPEA